MSIILQTENLCKLYRMGEQVVRALDGLSLTIRAGEFVAIMGASGSGKSTLLHLVGGLDVPTSGEILIEGTNLSSLSDRERTLFRRQRLGIVFQAFNLLPTLSAAENVALPLMVSGAPDRTIAQKTKELIELVHLAHRANHRPQAMSGGEQQRTAIARALVNDPALVLADEPTGNLDSSHAQEIWRLLAHLANDLGRTVLMVTHEGTAAAYAHRVCVLKDGRMVGEIINNGEPDAALVASRYQELAG